MRLGVFGGSFDPIHYGHLLLAECCREQAALDRVLFLPAATPPHKQGQPAAPADDRVAMIELAIAGHPAFGLSRWEVDRGGVNYTVDTLQALQAQFPGAELFFLMGADMFHDLPNWREVARVCQLATPLVVARAGAAPIRREALRGLLPAEAIEAMDRYQVQMPAMELSSSDLRRRVAQGLGVRFRTPPAVAEYILQRGVYRNAENATG